MTELSIINHELTGHPEVPTTTRGFRDEKIHFADSASAAGGGNYRGVFYRRPGACAVERRAPIREDQEIQVLKQRNSET